MLFLGRFVLVVLAAAACVRCADPEPPPAEPAARAITPATPINTCDDWPGKDLPYVMDSSIRISGPPPKASGRVVGMVQLWGMFDHEGKASAVCVHSGPPELRAPGVEAALLSRAEWRIPGERPSPGQHARGAIIYRFVDHDAAPPGFRKISAPGQPVAVDFAYDEQGNEVCLLRNVGKRVITRIEVLFPLAGACSPKHAAAPVLMYGGVSKNRPLKPGDLARVVIPAHVHLYPGCDAEVILRRVVFDDRNCWVGYACGDEHGR